MALAWWNARSARVLLWSRAYAFTWVEIGEQLVTSCEVESADEYPPHPQPLSRVGARGADSLDL